MRQEVDSHSNMASGGCSHCAGFYVVVSLILYIAQLVANGIYAHELYQTETVKTWFLPYIGLLLLPMVTMQLISAILLLTKSGDKMSSSTSISTALLHMLQLGFVWRHLSLFRERIEVNKSRDIGDLKLLQMFHTVASMLPLLLVQSFLFFHFEIRDVLIIITMLITLFGSCWHAAVLCENKGDDDKSESFEFQCPGNILLLVWRFGELVSRILSLAVFTSMYSYWIFLVVSLHALTMFVCLMSSVLGINETQGATRARTMLTNLLVAYVYTFFFTNSSSDTTNTSAFRYIFYYVVMFLENLVLTAVWYLRIDQSNHFEAQTIALASAASFFAAIVSMAIYFRWCSARGLIDSEKEYLFNPDRECINCRLSICSKHNIKRQRPFSAGWMSQYQTAVNNGQYYKNVLQDTLLDSEWDSVPDCLNSSGEHWQIRDTDLDSMQTNEKKSPVAGIQGAGTYSHKRFFDSAHSCMDIGDSDSITSGSGSGVYDEDWRQRSDALLSQLSAHDTLSLLSSRTQLLTDNWDNLTQSDGHLCRDPKHPKQIDILNSLIRKDPDSSFFSDGYMTDNTLISYQLPVTVLSKKRTRVYGRRGRPEPAFSTASDSTDCTICAFMRQHPSSPEMSGRDSRTRTHDIIPEESVKREARKKRRQLKLSNGRRRSRQHAKSSDRAGVCDIDSVLDQRRRVMSADRLTVPGRHVISSNSSFETDSTGRYPPTEALYAQPNKYAKRKYKQPPTIKMDVISNSELPTKPSIVPFKENCSETFSNHKDIDKLFRRKTSLTNASDSGDSAFPRSTPLSSYLVATDDDQDGQSVSSCEMII